MDLKSLDLLKRVSKRRVNEGMVASRISTHNIEALNTGKIDKLLRKPFKKGGITRV